MKQRSPSGYSLVEVLIAMAITSIVLLTVVSLFYLGRRNVYSGKQMTYAVSVGTRMMEDLSSMSATDLETNFNIDDNTALAPSVTVNGLAGGPNAGSGVLTFANSIKRDTTSCTAGAPTACPTVSFTCNDDTSCYLGKWRALIDESKLANAEVGIVLTPRSPANPASCTNCPWTTARFVKVRAYVAWDEAKNRRRIALFDTTKVNR